MARMSHGEMAHGFDQWVSAVDKWRSERTEAVREEQVAALRGEVAEHQEALSVERLQSVAALEERERLEVLHASSNAALEGELQQHREALETRTVDLQEERERVVLERLQSSEVCPFPGTNLRAWCM